MINKYRHWHRGVANTRFSAVPQFLTLSLVLCAACSPDFDQTPWGVYLIAYGESPSEPVYASVAAYNRFYDVRRDQKTTRQFYLPILASDDKVCLIDPGPAPEQNKKDKKKKKKKREKKLVQRGFTWFKAPVKLIGRAGWKRHKVTDIILTHAAANTCGNLTRFRHARVYIQDEELIRLRPKAPCWQVLNRLDRAGRLVRLNGDETVLDGVRVMETGRVTHGSQVVIVNTAAGVLAFMGPLAPFKENLQYASGPPGSFSLYGAAKAIRSLKQPGWTLVPSNDPSPPAGFVKVSRNHWKFAGQNAGTRKD